MSSSSPSLGAEAYAVLYTYIQYIFAWEASFELHIDIAPGDRGPCPPAPSLAPPFLFLRHLSPRCCTLRGR